MPDASLPDAKRARSLTIAGILDIVLGSLGLAVACLGTLVIGVMLCVILWQRASSPPAEALLTKDAGILVAGPIIGHGLLILASALADAWLVATGLQLLRRSRYARRSAITFACLMVPLGAIDVGIASRSGEARWLVLALVLPLPTYAVAQLAAFFVVPSWRALNGSEPRSDPVAA